VDVWVLWHTAVEDDEPDIKLIGVYSSRKSADDAVERLQIQPGFRESPDVVDDGEAAGFFVAKYTMDSDNWSAGFRSD
jgi:hypothetical protein